MAEIRPRFPTVYYVDVGPPDLPVPPVCYDSRSQRITQPPPPSPANSQPVAPRTRAESVVRI